MRWIGWTALVLTACTAHSDGGMTGSSLTVVDSAGVEIAEYTGGASAAQWVVAETADLTIPASGSGYDLFDIRDVEILADGELAVLNSGAHQVLVFGVDGTLLEVIGRRGEGPGEFVRPSFLAVVDDSLLVSDLANGRITVYSPSRDEVARTFSLETPPTPPPYSFPIGITNRLILARQGEVPAMPETDLGTRFLPIRILVFDMEGRLQTSWHAPGVSEFFIVELNQRKLPRSPPLGIRTFLDVESDGLVLARSDAHEIRSFQPDGSLSRVLRQSTPPPLLDASTVAAAGEAWIAQARDEGAAEARRKIFPLFPVPDHAHPVKDLKVDRLGHHWLEVGSSEDVRRWQVYHQNTLVGRVDIPADLVVHEIGVDFILGVWTDGVGAEHVVRHELTRER